MSSSNRTAAERAAVVLRHRITEGEFPPGTQLSEERLTALLGVSRNTLREAFRLLSHDGLLVHRLHRGVFVTELDAHDLVDLYRLRRLVECTVLRSLTWLDESRLSALRSEVETAEAAAAAGDWLGVGTANMHFHQHLVALADSPRINRVARQLLAELRLAFLVVDNPRMLHEPYVVGNRRLVDLLEARQFARAAEELEAYLRTSESHLLTAHGAATSEWRRIRG